MNIKIINLINDGINQYLCHSLSLNGLINRLESILIINDDNEINNKLLLMVNELEIINAFILSENRNISSEEKEAVDSLIYSILTNNDLFKILNTGIDLTFMKINNWALTKSQVFNLLNLLENYKIPVLGGNVFEIIDNEFHHNYDEWAFNKFSNESIEDFYTRSIKGTFDYIDKYIANDNKIYFCIDF